MNKSVLVVVNGLVQGVGFRYFALHRARQLGLAGYVRNLPDGSVEAEAEGEEKRLSDFIEYLRSGPPGARVDNLASEWKDYTGLYSNFNITR
jgi:acylphosphatase